MITGSAARPSKAQRVFVIVDNGSAHRGQRSIDRLQGTWSNLILVHTPSQVGCSGVTG
jgi:hypothetical protein